MGTARTFLAAALTAVLAGAAPAPAAAARADDPEVVSIAFAQPRIDVSTGWAVTTVSLHLRHAGGLQADMFPASSDNRQMVSAGGGEAGAAIGVIGWGRLAQVSGTPADGVWTATVELSAGWSGAYRVDRVQLIDLDGQAYYLPVENGPTLTVAGGRPWTLTNVPSPIKVVTGNERWRPQARITDPATGRGVGGARVAIGTIFDDLADRSRETTSPGPAADSSGRWTSPVTYGLDDQPESRYYPYGSRGSRGWSLQGAGCVNLSVKLQGSATYADTTLVDDQPLTVTGNVWPAPSIGPGGGPINLERYAGAAGWQTVATERARSNGRYTINWYPLQPGDHQIRVRMPGNGNPRCETGTVGTTLASTALSVTWSNR